jgi:hypothetical protein
MTRLHKLGKYKDGFKVIEYCVVCSAEGIELVEDCPGNFGDQYKKSLDEKKPTAK